MSELKKDVRDVFTQEKLPPPKSLRGEEDAEVTWDMILQRYPNAAPLLCEMETVIERAEGLLQQLRSPYNHALGRSSSFQIADSEDELMGPCNLEESTEVSMTSEQSSNLTLPQNMTPEVLSVAIGSERSLRNDEGNSISEQVLSAENIEPQEILSEEKPISVGEQTWSPDVSSSSILVTNSKSFEVTTSPVVLQDKISGVEKSSESPTPSKKSIEGREVEESPSLEAWGKVVGETVKRGKSLKSPVRVQGSVSQKPANTEEDSVSEHTRRLCAVKNGPIQETTNPNSIGKKEELAQRFAGTIATATKVVDTAKLIEGNEEQKIVGNVQTVEGSVVETPRESKIKQPVRVIRKTCRNITEPEKNNQVFAEPNARKNRENLDDEVQGNGDEGVATPRSVRRSPVEILEEYSRICDVPVEYKIQNSNNSFHKNVVVKCCLSGFASESCAPSRKAAHNGAAASVLRCLMGRQIDGDNMQGLTPFTRKQIEEIMCLGTGGQFETSIRKLFKLCMEENAPEPIYTLQQSSGIMGNRFTAKCEALGYVESANAVRECSAKRLAAEALLRCYHKNRNATN